MKIRPYRVITHPKAHYDKYKKYHPHSPGYNKFPVTTAKSRVYLSDVLSTKFEGNRRYFFSARHRMKRVNYYHMSYNINLRRFDDERRNSFKFHWHHVVGFGPKAGDRELLERIQNEWADHRENSFLHTVEYVETGNDNNYECHHVFWFKEQEDAMLFKLTYL